MNPPGITSTAAEIYIREHGRNEIVQKKDSLLARMVKQSFSFISGMLFLAALLSLVSGKDFDFFFILVLLVINVGITIWQEYKADNAIEKLNEGLSVSVRTLRDGLWQDITSRTLVPKDVIRLRSGNVVPADAQIIEAASLSVNEAALTGESLPKEKTVGEILYSGSFIASGLVTAEITATGNQTKFGAAVIHVDRSTKRSSLENDILRISRFLSILSLSAVIILSWILITKNTPILDVLRLDLSLIIAGIPISLPTVMTLIITFGTIALAKKKVIVRRLSSLEELANTSFLLTDKTGTLTENRIEVHEVLPYGIYTEDIVREFARAVAQEEPESDINRAILGHEGATSTGSDERYLPGDSVRKRSTLTREISGSIETISLGAPQIIASLCSMSDAVRKHLETDVERLAQRGYRCVALARTNGDKEENMSFVALISLSDTVRPDAASAIRFLEESGVGVAIVTGDNRAIAGEVAREVGISGTDILTKKDLLKQGFDTLTKKNFDQVAAFAEILPEDKYELVTVAKKFYTVAANGDGVNDLPAVRAADVGFAVSNAVDALKAAADIVLLSDGIHVIRDAFVEGRKIFARLYGYSVYRISESFRLIVTIAILGVTTGIYPLSPLQLIILALLNDIPIISLATDQVKAAHRPANVNVREQFGRSTLFGMVGVANSLLLYFIATQYWHLPIALVQTLFFLKLTVSGHLLIYVAHTEERWWRYLPSHAVIIATILTQGAATIFAVTGFLMPGAISWQLVGFIWIWSLLFMQLSEVVKYVRFGKIARFLPGT